MAQKRRSLITGVTGFVGKHLAEHLLEQGHEIYGTDRWETCTVPGIHYNQLDVLDASGLQKLMSMAVPDYVFHLAAISFLPEADASPRLAIEINIGGTVCVLDAVRQTSQSTQTLLVGSCKEYSETKDEKVTENSIPLPSNFYGITKYTAELIGMQYADQFGLDVRATRSFNHTGPGQSPRFVCSDWAKQIAEIQLLGKPALIEVGNLEETIDFMDVRDVVRAYDQILTKGQKGEVYNVCSGKGISLGWILKHLVSKSDRQIEVVKRDTRFRSGANKRPLIGDDSKIFQQTGWKSTIPFEKTLDDLYGYWIDQIRLEQSTRTHLK